MPYIGNQPGTGTRNRFIYTATASQTTFSGADDNGKTLKYADSDYVDVYLNGICLVPVTDYTSTSKTSIVLTQAASLNDTLEVVAYDIATISDTVSKADGGTFDGNVTFADGADIITATAGANNVRIGTNAGDSILTGGDNNTVVGNNAGTAITTGTNNTLLGSAAGDAITDGNTNVAVGSSALTTNVQGDRNVAVGYKALETLNPAGDADTNNTAVGYNSGSMITTGANNTLLGSGTGDALTTGDDNVAVGINAGGGGDNWSRCVAVGRAALASHNPSGTTSTATANTALGYDSLTTLSTGTNNTALGYRSNYLATTGSKNTVLGSFSGNQDNVDIRTESNNVVLSDGDGVPAYWAEGDGTNYEHYWRVLFSGDATGFGAGAAANTWHQITAWDFNDGRCTNANVWIIMNFANANTAYGYTGQMHAQFANASSNVSYTGATNGGCDASGTMGWQLPITVGVHTGTSSLVFEAKIENTGSNKRLSVRTNAGITSNTAVFGIPKLHVISRKWIED